MAVGRATARLEKMSDDADDDDDAGDVDANGDARGRGTCGRCVRDVVGCVRRAHGVSRARARVERGVERATETRGRGRGRGHGDA